MLIQLDIKAIYMLLGGMHILLILGCMLLYRLNKAEERIEKLEVKTSETGREV